MWLDKSIKVTAVGSFVFWTSKGLDRGKRMGGKRGEEGIGGGGRPDGQGAQTLGTHRRETKQDMYVGTDKACTESRRLCMAASTASTARAQGEVEGEGDGKGTNGSWPRKGPEGCS